MTPDPNPVPSPVAVHWESLLEDASATARGYREDGWDPLVVHTADVGVLTGERYGFDVIAPGDEFETLQALADGATFDESHVFRTEEGGVRFLLVVVEATDSRDVVLVPAYAPLAETPPLRERAQAEGEMYTHVRPLSDDTRVTFSHDDPTPFF